MIGALEHGRSYLIRLPRHRLTQISFVLHPHNDPRTISLYGAPEVAELVRSIAAVVLQLAAGDHLPPPAATFLLPHALLLQCDRKPSKLRLKGDHFLYDGERLDPVEWQLKFSLCVDNSANRTEP